MLGLGPACVLNSWKDDASPIHLGNRLVAARLNRLPNYCSGRRQGPVNYSMWQGIARRQSSQWIEEICVGHDVRVLLGGESSCGELTAQEVAQFEVARAICNRWE
jgi:hypothetical protein